MFAGNKVNYKTIVVSKTNGMVNIMVADRETKETIPMAGVVLQREDGMRKFIRTNLDGVASCNDIIAGKYIVKIYTPGFSEKSTASLKIKNGSKGELKVIMIANSNLEILKKAKISSAEF